MRLAVLVALLIAPACTHPPEHGDPEPIEYPDCGIPMMQVVGEVQVSLTRTAVGEGCPFVYDRRDYLFLAAGGAITSQDSPVYIESSSIEESTDEAYVSIVLTDEWGVGTTDEQVFAPGTLVFDLLLGDDGAVTGVVTGTVPYEGTTCTITYAATGSFTPEWE